MYPSSTHRPRRRRRLAALFALDCPEINYLRNNTSNTMTTLASGTVAALGTNSWHRLGLTFSGSTITAVIDGATVGSVADCTGTTAQQRTFNSNGTVTNVASGLCLDAYGAGTTNGTPTIVWGCNSGSNQSWTRR